MKRVYRLSMIGARLPLHHRYGPATTIDGCEPGFEAFKGPIFSLANSIAPAPGSLGEGDFTPAAGYHELLLIDVRAVQAHKWNPFTWIVVLTPDVAGVRSVAISELHSWLRQQTECLSHDGQLSREQVE